MSAGDGGTVLLLAGDHFVRNDLLFAALSDEGVLPGPEVRELVLPWPDVPFGDVGGVREASGDEDELLAALDGVSVCVTQMAPFTRRVLEGTTGLRLVCVTRGGPVNVDLGAAAERGVAVSFAPGRNASATAEHTVAMMLAAIRRIPQHHADLAAGRWGGDAYRYDEVGRELGQSVVGLVGYGAIGRRVAAIVRGFGARVLVHDPHARVEEDEATEAVGLADLLRRAHVVSLHARATPETDGLIGEAELALLAPDAVLVNCARGSLVDEAALAAALREGRLGGAALDVFATEPLSRDSPLVGAPGLVTTPHLAGASTETAHRAARISAAEVARHLRGEELSHRA